VQSFKPKDALKTHDNLYYSVIKAGLEAGKVLCCLRYRYHYGCWEKFNTRSAHHFLRQYSPDVLFYSTSMDVEVHAIAIDDIEVHYQPHECLPLLLQQNTDDTVIKDLITLCELFSAKGLDLTQVGVTGSLLIGAQNPLSDIDLVFYNRDLFYQEQRVTQQLMTDDKLQPLSRTHWQESFTRREGELSFEEYHWHEQRKVNKVLINGRKVDLTLLDKEKNNTPPLSYIKQGKITLTARITDDYYSFDTPALFLINHPEIKTVLCFTATYSGQAKKGEIVEISGQLEKAENGHLQIIVGSSREAKQEYIRVLQNTSFYSPICDSL
jgi:predicted nucleotidyltransferase